MQSYGVPLAHLYMSLRDTLILHFLFYTLHYIYWYFYKNFPHNKSKGGGKMSGKIVDYKNNNITGNLIEDLLTFRNIFKKDASFRIKEISARKNVPFDCALLYLDGMVNSEQLNESVIKPILTVETPFNAKDLADYVSTQILFARDVKKTSDISKILEGILYGEALILIENSPVALMVDVKGWRTRGVSEPQDERVLQGPREGFDEAALLNVALVRRKLQTPDFCAETLRVGRRSATLVFVCYLDSLVNKKIVREVKKRINQIDIDGILDSNYITEQIKDNKYPLFKTIGTTERPDIVAARLLEGRVALIVDGTPVVLTVPYLFSENFQSDEDYYLNFLITSFNRFLRYVCFVISITIPAVFVALSTYHRELLPTTFAITVAKLRSGVPFSPLSECIVLIFVFEILKETGVRMPQSLGHALSIVGGLVVGQAAVEANIISTPMLIVIALSGITGLMVPRLNEAVFYLRVAFVIFGALFGLYGVVAFAFAVVFHILSLTTFGIDYTVSLKKANLQSLKDTVFRASWKNMIKRPLFNKNIVRKG